MLPTVKRLRTTCRHVVKALVSVVLSTVLVVKPAIALNDAQQLVVESWKLVNQSYVNPDRFEEVHWKRLRQKALEGTITSSEQAYSAIETMLSPLGDPYTRLLRPDDYTVMKASNQGSVSGVGLQLAHGSDDGRVVVIAPLEGSPAAEAGVVSGTAVLAVNGEPTEGLGLETTAARLRGDVGTQVVLTLQAPDGTTNEVTLERRSVDLRTVRTRRLRQNDHTLGYLRITQFSEGVPQQVQEAIAELSEKGIEGLVLDLRNNSGGLVSAGLAVADAFISNDPIVETRNRDGIADPIQASASTLYDGQMVTLVNGGTASASEILPVRSRTMAAPNCWGVEPSERLIQTLTNLSDGSGLAVTVAGYSLNGRDIQGQGLEPDRTLVNPNRSIPAGTRQLADRCPTGHEPLLEKGRPRPAQ